MKSTALSAPFIASLVATPICLFVALASAGAGHGNYFWAKVLFPYTMVSTLVFQSITAPFVVLAIVQFPAYGIALGLASQRHKFGRTFIVLAVAHVLMALWLLLFPPDNFN